MKTAPQKGFTLIEILLVVAIIGLLASVVLASLGTAKSKAAVSKRIQSAKQVENALELYYTKNGQYPSTCTTGPLTSCAVGLTSRSTMCTNLDQLAGGPTGWIPSIVTAGFISSLPTDPDTDGLSKCCFIYRSTGTDYKLQIAYNCKAPANGTITTYSVFPTFTDPNHDGSADCNVTPAGVDGDAGPTWAIYSKNACGGGWN